MFWCRGCELLVRTLGTFGSLFWGFCSIILVFAGLLEVILLVRIGYRFQLVKNLRLVNRMVFGCL